MGHDRKTSQREKEAQISSSTNESTCFCHMIISAVGTAVRLLRQPIAPKIYNKIIFIEKLLCRQMLGRLEMKRWEVDVTSENAHK